LVFGQPRTQERGTHRSQHVHAPNGNQPDQGLGLQDSSCLNFGQTILFSPSKLAKLYPTHAQFVSDWDRATLKDVLDGYLLLPDAVELDNAALLSDIG
jgi:hypothetical protein